MTAQEKAEQYMKSTHPNKEPCFVRKRVGGVIFHETDFCKCEVKVAFVAGYCSALQDAALKIEEIAAHSIELESGVYCAWKNAAKTVRKMMNEEGE